MVTGPTHGPISRESSVGRNQQFLDMVVP